MLSKLDFQYHVFLVMEAKWWEVRSEYLKRFQMIICLWLSSGDSIQWSKNAEVSWVHSKGVPEEQVTTESAEFWLPLDPFIHLNYLTCPFQEKVLQKYSCAASAQRNINVVKFLKDLKQSYILTPTVYPTRLKPSRLADGWACVPLCSKIIYRNFATTRHT